MDRRFFLRGAALLGCSAAAHPLLSTVTLAQGQAAFGDNRLIVVILRGAMDGLDAVQPIADPMFASYRPTLGAAGQAVDLDGFFGLNVHLGGLKPLYDAGELGFVHATSTPYRDKRSHFDGQDMLEAGTGLDVAPSAVRDGWMNRMLMAVPGITAETAYAIGRDAQPLLAGKAGVRNWTPDVALDLSAQSRLLLEHIYHDDDLFREAALEAMDLATYGETAEMGEGADKQFRDIDTLVDFAAGRLREDTRVAAFSLSGWDTHRSQGKVIVKSFQGLERLILRLRDQLGEAWGKTALLAVTEFGRTARENGSRGTDHGTGGVMVLAGGAVRGGKVLGKWPGLAEADLYDRRDLMPTSDVREWAAAAMRGLYGFDRAVLEGAVFPGLKMGDDLPIIR